MATISFTVPDAIAPRVLDKFCNSYGMTGTNAEKTAFVKEKTIEFWKNRLRMSENPPIATAAVTSNDQDITNLNIT